MNITRITLALAVIAAAGLSTSDLRAQEYTLPPAPNSGTDVGFSAENGPCFYNPYAWAATSLLNNSAVGAEVQVMLDAETAAESAATRTGLTQLRSSSSVGLHVHRRAGALKRLGTCPQEEVQRIKELSRVAAEAGPPRTPQSAPLDLTPPLRVGDAHRARPGSAYRRGVRLERTDFAVSGTQGWPPGPKPATYNGIPIVERGQSWERLETADGRRLWRQSEPINNSYGSRAGVRSRYASAERANARMPKNAAYERLQRQEGIRAAPRSAASTPSSSSGASSASSPPPRPRRARCGERARSSPSSVGFRLAFERRLRTGCGAAVFFGRSPFCVSQRPVSSVPPTLADPARRPSLRLPSRPAFRRGPGTPPSRPGRRGRDSRTRNSAAG